MYFYVLCTLFDITATGVLNYKADIDNLYQRNQQRNWQVIQQLIQLRSQPLLITQSMVDTFDVSNFDFGDFFNGMHKVWYLIFSVEYDQLYLKNQNSIAGLLDDFSYVPMINELNETADLSPPTLLTNGSKTNICFYTNNNYPSCLQIDFNKFQNENN